ncbi:MAG: lipoprotein releasing system, transrane protein LolC/E family [Cyanobacteria bacterium RYN_339]|nr:lipoprotein releasing system, transrane protein LolC/E family [Cyanobacteria bacterium RYN_339]
MGYLLFLAWAQLRVRPWQSLLLVLSVSVGVTILTTALSLTNGFEQDMVDRLLGTTPHVSLYNPLSGGLTNYNEVAARVVGRPHVTSVIPFIQGQGLVTSDAKSTTGVLVRGVDPAVQAKSPSWGKYLVSGHLEDPGGGPGIVLGTEVARKLGVGLGDTLKVITGAGKQRTATVTGLFESGLYEFDAHVAFMTLPTAQTVFGMPKSVTGLDVQVDDVFMAPQLARELSTELMLGARSWSDQNRPLLKAMFLERVVIFIVIMFIVLVAMIGVGSTMAMWVIEKNREISLLRAIGVAAPLVGRLFVVQGTLISAVGVLLGSLGGVVLSLALAAFPIGLAGEVYFLSHLPVRMEGRDFLLVALATLLLSPVASVLPALRAMRLDPIEVIRRT